MKKTLLTAGLIALTFGAFAQFTANRLVVVEYDQGPVAVGSKIALPVFLKQYSLTPGTETKSVPMPTTASGLNFPFSGMTSGGNEGLITLSTDGTSLAIFGHGVAPDGTTATTATSLRTMALVTNGVGTVNINTTTTQTATATTVAGPRCAFTDGLGFWTCSSAGGIFYTALGTSTQVVVNNSQVSNRSVNIYNGQLYSTTNGSSVYHVATVGTGMPKTSPAPLVALPGLSSAPSIPNQAVFLKTTAGAGAPDLIYTVSDADGKIEKFVYDSVNSTWVAKGTVLAATPDATYGLKGITARIVNDTAFVYANSTSKLLAVRDTLNSVHTFSDLNNPVVTLATAPTNTQFKGVAFTPGSTINTVLPIKLSSFTGKSELNGAQLSWTTSSEKNNNHFEVLRSTDGTQFSKIGQVAGSGNSDAALNYSFLDRNAAIGANYYKLNQVDNNGTSEEFGPVVVTLNGQAAAISVYANKASGQINVNVFANKGGEGVLNVYDAGGKVIAKQNVSLQAGNNQISLNSQNAGAGLHIVSLTFAGETLTKKFIFQ
jgi:hypothetical protein